MTGHRRARGFTLVELMISVAIVGLLASVAVPVLTRATLRARAAERATVMRAIADAVGDTVSIQQRVPFGGTWVGVQNPGGVPGTSKRRFDWTASGWPDLSMVVMGDAYYSYSFVAKDDPVSGLTLTVSALGDLDGDGVASPKTLYYEGVGYVLQPDRVTPETPPRGEEDRTTF